MKKNKIEEAQKRTKKLLCNQLIQGMYQEYLLTNYNDENHMTEEEYTKLIKSLRFKITMKK